MLQRAPPIVRRWVPFVAVAAANCINIPVMRQRELIDGVMVTDREGNNLAKSKVSWVTRHLRPCSINVVFRWQHGLGYLWSRYQGLA